jgi:hypothetical protein
MSALQKQFCESDRPVTVPVKGFSRLGGTILTDAQAFMARTSFWQFAAFIIHLSFKNKI